MANRIAVAPVKNGARTGASSSTGATRSASQQEEIARLAYQLFVDRGYQHGHHEEDWLRAEAIVRKRRS